MTEENDDDLVVMRRTTVDEIITSLEELREQVKAENEKYRRELFRFGKMAGEATLERDAMHAELLKTKVLLNWLLGHYLGDIAGNVRNACPKDLLDTFDAAAARLGLLAENPHGD